MSHTGVFLDKICQNENESEMPSVLSFFYRESNLLFQQDNKKKTDNAAE